MRSRFLIPRALVAVGLAVGWLAGSGRLADVAAQDPKVGTAPEPKPAGKKP